MNCLEYLGWPGKANYSAAASGIFGLTRSLALELAKDDITVNCLSRGDILYPEAGLAEEAAAKLADAQPVKRLGTPEDVANAVGFFASEASKYITGQTLFVCGGKSLYFSMSV
jgi:3-oxoacyl-[acyl-carrier protein] reductase/2-[hydroxy(phenyl)methyl]-succinyl-CoA dehydrogenase BbsC subunit